MKILYVGYHNPNFISITEYIEGAIAGLGHELLTYDYRDWLIPGRVRDRVEFLHAWDISRINKNLIKKAEKFKPDILLVNGGWTISPNTILELREKNEVIAINWIADYPLRFEDYLKAGPYYDCFLTSGTDALERYREEDNINGSWLPFACNPSVHKKVELTKKEIEKYSCDICFVGTNYPERAKILEGLCDYDLSIWGLGWEKLPAGSPLKAHVRGGKVKPEEWVKIYNASKIALNISYSEGLAIDNQTFRMCNTRVFEILGCGAFQLMDARQDAMDLFKDREHMVFYRNEDELKRVVGEYLVRVEERERISASGMQEVLKKHTYEHRIKQLLEIVS